MNYTDYMSDEQITAVRNAVRDYFGTAMESGFPMAVMELGRADAMSDEEVVEFAVRHHIVNLTIDE